MHMSSPFTPSVRERSESQKNSIDTYCSLPIYVYSIDSHVISCTVGWYSIQFPIRSPQNRKSRQQQFPILPIDCTENWAPLLFQRTIVTKQEKKGKNENAYIRRREDWCEAQLRRVFVIVHRSRVYFIRNSPLSLLHTYLLSSWRGFRFVCGVAVGGGMCGRSIAGPWSAMRLRFIAEPINAKQKTSFSGFGGVIDTTHLVYQHPLYPPTPCIPKLFPLLSSLFLSVQMANYFVSHFILCIDCVRILNAVQLLDFDDCL